MNKLIVIGNGFDLHHGLPTSYCSFVRWQVRKTIENLLDGKECLSELISMTMGESSFGLPSDQVCEDLDQIVDQLLMPGSFIGSTDSTKTILYENKRYNVSISCRSSLYQNILHKHTTVNWVDIEMEYFKLLTEILCLLNTGKRKEKSALDRLEKLNDDLYHTIREFTEYLREVTENAGANRRFGDLASDDISIRNISNEHHYNKLGDAEFSDENKRYIKPRKVLFLNFNYTALPKHLYDRDNNFQHINIHGSVGRRSAPPVFGYGDEIGEEYAQLENTNNNDFLKFVKSFAYSQNSAYSDLLRFINSDSYMVYLWGHSCGLSDRTLLNMVFEHDKCAAIQPFYWKKEDRTDNFTEIIQNLSRHFKNKQKFRDRLVNKELCVAL